MSGDGLRERAVAFFRDLQDRICAALEAADGGARFREDLWERAAGGGGGGRTRVLQEGALFEKGGVNWSGVSGTLPESIARERGPADDATFFATGISLVLHPRSPMVPTVHMNCRYLERGASDHPARVAWFGGGADLTPYYVFEEDARHFHRTLRAACDRHDPAYYPRFKRWCDEYFFIPHRKEPRGVGGIFFDHLGAAPGDAPLEAIFAFVRDVGESFLPAYLPIVERRRALPWGERERRWQLARRGRYVEFNLVYDRGTTFGLRTDGRAESILMSLPPAVAFPYAFSPEPGSEEARLLELLSPPQEWGADS